MKALVTGAAGFVGRHMAHALGVRGYEVSVVDTDYGYDAHEVFAGRFSASIYDLVVHAAASSPHRAAIDGEPVHFARNVQLDAAMFDWAVRTGQRRVLYLSSSAVYPVELQRDPKWGRLIEEDVDLDEVRQPDARYGWTKLTGEQLARAAAESGLPVHVVRTFSGYGEDQADVFPFPAIVARASKGDLTVWGPPGQTRDWIHISDVVAGALAVVDADVRDPVNLCTGIGTEMGELAVLVAKTAGVEVDRVTYLKDKPTGVLYRVGDPNRFHQIYKPQVSIEEGVRRALEA